MKLVRLADGELEQEIRAALIDSDAPWPVPPLIADETSWQLLRKEPAAKQIESLAAHLATNNLWLNCAPIRRIRMLPLLCYRDGLLIEAETATFDGRPGLLTFVSVAAGLFLLDGTSPPLHAANIAGDRIDLTEPENVIQYLKLFCSAVQSEVGPFRVVEEVRDIQFATPPTAEMEYNLMMCVKRLGEPKPAEHGEAWQARAIVTQANALFNSLFTIRKTGIIEMTEDDQVAQGLPLRQIKFQGLLRADSG